MIPKSALRIPFDQYQRYRIVADIINKFRNGDEIFEIIDIGANIEANLKQFLPNDNIYFLDKEYPPEYEQKPEYIVGDFTELNLDRNYDFVVSLDVYEHVNPTSREKFIDKSLALSKVATILAAPFDTPGVSDYEVFANELYRLSHGIEHKWLQEHIDNKLPSLSSTLDLIKNHGFDYTLIPNGFLPRWFEMISIYLLTEGMPELSKSMEELCEFYNSNFYIYDNLNPAYRQIIVINKSNIEPDLSDFFAKNPNDDEFFDIRYEILQSFIGKIRDKELIEKCIQVVKLSESLQEKNTKLIELTETVQENNMEIIGLTNILQSMQQSLTWRTLMKFQRFSEIVLPNNTRRRKLYDLMFESLMILSNDGIRKFFSRSMHRRKRSSHHENKLINLKSINSILDFYEQSRRPDIVANHRSTVDIIICVHNALEDVKKCLESIIKYTTNPYSLILVDDGSDNPTRSYLEEFAKTSEAHLIQNNIAKGYTFASNQGFRASSADHVVLLNSDTIVTPEWLDRMVACAESDDHTGIIGPLSNTASWQSVPDIEVHGDWAQNNLPPDVSIEHMGILISKYSGRLYPKIPFLNGFCLLIKRTLIDDIGIFDEELFGEGYGEENDYCIRARKAQWNLRIADDVYIYHAQSRSYSDERRKELCKRADSALITKHGKHIVEDGVFDCQYNRVLEGIRARAKALFIRNELANKIQEMRGTRILVILPVMDPGGGAYVVIQECMAMLDMGIDIHLLNLKKHETEFERHYPDLKLPVIYSEIADISAVAEKFDAVISTSNISVDWLKYVVQKENKTKIGYYIQDFEPYFYQKWTRAYQKAWESYTRFPNLIRITKTRWNEEIVKQKIGVDCNIVGPSVDIDLFRPRPRYEENPQNRPIYIGAMVRPTSSRRAPQMTMEILREVWWKFKDKIQIITFGCSDDELNSMDTINDFPYNHAGLLSRQQLASLFNEFDIFVDFSSFQAMGLTALEAMACGAAVIVPEAGGAKEIVSNEVNGLVINSSSKDACLKAVNQLIKNDELRIRLGRQASKDACEFPPEKAAYNVLNALHMKN